ncbi:MAG TPA: hypothetical protein VHI52_09860, partial [Verrucomicrobiae bacterium]|nr:hypothetical protein [Verrucomicrobiae bacterium]
TRVVRRWLPWRGVPRTQEAEVSLAALLARRDQVRSAQAAPPLEPKPELFRPVRPAEELAPLPGTAQGAANEPQPETSPAQAEPPKEAPSSTASRLLEAKRRAQKRRS